MPRNSWVTGGISSDTSRKAGADNRKKPIGNSSTTVANKATGSGIINHPFLARRARVWWRELTAITAGTYPRTYWALVGYPLFADCNATPSTPRDFSRKNRTGGRKNPTRPSLEMADIGQTGFDGHPGGDR
jgi:hypothetical protein